MAIYRGSLTVSESATQSEQKWFICTTRNWVIKCLASTCYTPVGSSSLIAETIRSERNGSASLSHASWFDKIEIGGK
jgi:hypothetical protein